MLKKTLLSFFTIYQFTSSQAPPPYIPEPYIPQIPTEIPGGIQPPPVQTQPQPPIQTQAIPPVQIPPVPTQGIPQLPPVVPPIQTQPVAPIPPVVTEPQIPQVTVGLPPIPVVPIATEPAPVTSTTTLAPEPVAPGSVAPSGYVFGAHGQHCPEIALTSTKCNSADMILFGEDSIRCGMDSECCMCNSIECGLLATGGCNNVYFGDSSGYGVKNINIIGNRQNGAAGAVIDCQGTESCRGTQIVGENIQYIHCKGDKACEGAHFVINEPKPGFELNCEGMGSCNMLVIDINLAGPPAGYKCKDVLIKDILNIRGVSCDNDISCEGMEITINNAGCDKLILDSIECNAFESCNAAKFNFIGDIDIIQCECGPSCTNTQGLGKCFTNLAQLVCPTVESCKDINKKIINPMNAFELKCGDTRSCENSHFTFELNQQGPDAINYLKGFFLSGESAGRGATFEIDNKQGTEVTMELIECSGVNSCTDTTFVLPESITVTKVLCSLGACENCLIQTSLVDAGRPCDPTGMSIPTSTTSTSTTTTTTTTTTTPVSTSSTQSTASSTPVQQVTQPQQTAAVVTNPGGPAIPAFTQPPVSPVTTQRVVPPQVTQGQGPPAAVSTSLPGPPAPPSQIISGPPPAQIVQIPNLIPV